MTNLGPREIDGYKIDVATKEEYGYPSEVTKVPIESGSDTSDHNRVMNDTYTIEGIVSDTPIGDIEAQRNLEGTTKPSDECRAHMLKLRDTKRPVTVISGRGVLESMAMTSFEHTDDNEKYGGLHFTAKFEKQRITVINRVVTVPRAESGEGLGNRTAKSHSPFSSDKIIVDRTAKMWLDPDLSVYVNGKPGVDVPELNSGQSSGGLRLFQVWRKTASWNDKTRKYDAAKGELLDGFYSSDEVMKNYVKNLTPEKRKLLIPPSQPGSKANSAADLAKRTQDRQSKLRVLENGDVGTISPSDPRWKNSKPFVPKKP